MNMNESSIEYSKSNLFNPQGKFCLIATPSALVVALSKLPPNTSYLLIDLSELPDKLNKRNNLEICKEILINLKLKYVILKPSGINEYLRKSTGLEYIEFFLLEILKKHNLIKCKENWNVIFFGADIYLARINFLTFFNGYKSIIEHFYWKNRIKNLPIENIIIPKIKNNKKKICKINLINVTSDELQNLTLSLLKTNFYNELGIDLKVIECFYFFGGESDEFSNYKNILKIKNKVKKSSMEKVSHILVKSHPNIDNLHSESITSINRIAQELGLDILNSIKFQKIPSELLIFLPQMAHYFGVPSSALMALERGKYTTILPNKTLRNLSKRSYLQSRIK